MKTLAVTIARPGTGTYQPDMLSVRPIDLPDPAEGEIRVRMVYISLDPTNRNWLKLDPRNTLSLKTERSLGVGKPMMGQALGIVEASDMPGFAPGDRVAFLGEWQERVNVPAEACYRLDLAPGEPLSAYLTLFSHIGMAALTGVHDVLRLQRGETLLVTAAAGATGALAVEIARDRGARVIGIAGGAEKARRVVEDHGAEAAIDYRSQDIDAELVRLCPDGIDAFFDNVGGEQMDIALKHMRLNGRIAICGVMADYDVPEAERRGIRNMFNVLIRALRIEGFLAGRSGRPRDVQIAELRELFARGAISHRPHIVQGIERLPEYLSLLFAGRNEGKLIVQVGEE